MKGQRLLATVLATVLLLTGCTSLSLNDSDLLSPPKASGNRAEIQSMIEKDAKGKYQLISPVSGAYKNGIIRYDVDSDGAEEAIALYTASDNTPRLLVATEYSSGYQLIGSVDMYSSNIKEVRFADVNADGRTEPIIIYDDGPSVYALQAFIINNDVSEALIATSASGYLLGDFDNDTSVDVLITESSEEHLSGASLMIYSDDGFIEASSCGIDPAVVSCVDLRFSAISETISGAVLDGKLADGDYTTQLLYYDTAADLLVNPLIMNSSYTETTRSLAVRCADIDKDDIIEVPICSPMASAKDEDPDDVCTLIRWSSYEPELMSLSVKETAVLCDRLDFMLELDALTLSSVTARYTSENTVSFYKLTYKDGEPIIGKEQLTIKRFSNSSFDKSLTTDTILYEDSAYIYTYTLPDTSVVSAESVNNGFKPLEAALL